MNILNTIIQKPNTNIYQAQTQKKQENKQNIFAPIATTSLIKPDRPQNSYIVNDPFYMLPINFVKDIKENIVNIAKATTGKSNDHDLGRINDFSMKAGALAIAGYLFTHGKTSLSKTMEFVGFGSFFASMALWPKLFIQTPLKAMYGLDIHQKYVDNEGRKKMFFQDPQYIPWDLYSDEELSKLGDKLGVPRDIHNRNEIIKKKAHKIALQGNTLWMLTAGFATPLMCALMCNGFERIVTPRSERTTFPNNIFGAFASSIEKIKIDNTENHLKKINATASNIAANLDQSRLAAFLKLHIGEELTPKLLMEIQSRMHSSDDVLERETVERQIKAIIETKTIIPETSEEYIKEIADKIQNYKSDLNINYDELRGLFTEELLKELAIEDDKQIPIENFKNKLRTLIFTNSNISEANQDFYSKALDEIIGDAQDIEIKQITENFSDRILRLDRNLYENSLRLDALHRYQTLFFGDVGDSIATNRWNNTSKAFFEILGYSNKELAIARNDGEDSYKLLLSKLEQLVSDDGKYETAVKKLQRAILDYDQMFLPDGADGSTQGIKKVATELINEYAQKASKMFEDGGFDIMRKRIVGDASSQQGSIQDNLIKNMSRRIEGLRSGLYKLLHTLDFFRRTRMVMNNKTKELELNPEIIKTYSSIKDNQLIEKGITDAQILQDIKQYKDIALRATIADHTTKFNMENPQKELYKRLMEVIYDTKLDEQTKKALGVTSDGLDASKLGTTNFITSFINRVREIKDNLGNFIYPHADKVVLGTNQQVGDALHRDSLLGKKIVDFARETASQNYNSSKWLGKFGTMSAVLVGVTLLSQAFFGKLNKQDLEYIRKDKA